jgi:hypothetical protein
MCAHSPDAVSCALLTLTRTYAHICIAQQAVNGGGGGGGVSISVQRPSLPSATATAVTKPVAAANGSTATVNGTSPVASTQAAVAAVAAARGSKREAGVYVKGAAAKVAEALPLLHAALAAAEARVVRVDVAEPQQLRILIGKGGGTINKVCVRLRIVVIMFGTAEER